MKIKICSTILFLSFPLFLFNLPVLALSQNWSLQPRPLQPWSLPKERYQSDEILVKFKSDLQPFRRLKIPQGRSFKETLSQYLKDPQVEYAEPNYYVQALMIPNDPYYQYQWHLQQLQTETAWDQSTGSGVTVAVIDTGIAYENYGRYQQAPDLAKTCFVEGFDFVNRDSHPNDDHGHGTHISGTIAQSTNNNIGVAGIAFNACLIPIKVLDSRGSGTHAAVADGIYWATDHGAKVINLSLGSHDSSETLKNAVAYAYHHGVTVVAAAGNDGSSGPPNYPAAYNDYVLAVAATRFDKTLAPYSNTGAYLDLSAPGGDLNVDQNHDGYADGILQQTFKIKRGRTEWAYYFWQGTSCATPHVSGTAALLISHGITNPDEIRNILQTTAEDLGTTGWDENYGWGLVNPAVALGEETPTVTPSPSQTPSPTATPSSTLSPSPTPNPTPSPTLTPTPNPSPTPIPTPTLTPNPTPTSKINVILQEVSAEDTRVYRNYQVKATIKNQESSSVTVTTHLEIKDPGNQTVSWSGMEDKTVTLSPVENKTLEWSGRVPGRTAIGVYTATVSLFYQDILLDQKSTTFSVSRWSWR